MEYVEGAKGFQFHFGTDGSGFDAIIEPDGGSRNQVSPESFILKEYEGKMMHNLQTHMKGMDVFSFGITTAPKSIKKLGEHFGFDVYETPGHNPSCLCYANSEVVFTGDAYIPGCKVVTNLPHCDKTLAEVSIEKILFIAKNKLINPGHDLEEERLAGRG